MPAGQSSVPYLCLRSWAFHDAVCDETDAGRSPESGGGGVVPVRHTGRVGNAAFCVLVICVVIALQVRSEGAARADTYCREPDWSAFWSDTGEPYCWECACDTRTLAVDDITEDYCASGSYWIRVTTTACEDQDPADGGVFAIDDELEWPNNLVQIGELVDGVWESTCNDWDHYLGIHVRNLSQTVSEVLVEAFCCESCCAAQSVACGTGGTSAGLWYFNGCDCVQQLCTINQTCVGVDCDERFISESACQNAYQNPPHDECLDAC